ncbi:hypothetical protein AB4Z40_08690 [Bosea sp. 2YAB26]|uniref:hypothetical protein n=1 Tax=Bosea sp. 2YAB26 TaxID=3237478 RepID=UPI003F916D43
MIVASDPLSDVKSLPGGEFVTACIDVVESRARALRAREERYRRENKVVSTDAIREAALLTAVASMLEQIKADGAAMTPDWPNRTVKNAVIAGKHAFIAVEKAKP